MTIITNNAFTTIRNAANKVVAFVKEMSSKIKKFTSVAHEKVTAFFFPLGYKSKTIILRF